MDEFSLIDKIKQTTYKQSSLIKGIGDDAAVFRETSGDLVVAVDTFVEDVHFTKQTMSPFQIGYRALAANLSDMAAMGAVPMYYLVSITVPESWKESSILNIFGGMRELASTYQVDLLGGDTVSGNDLVLSITIIGNVLKNRARYRSDAKAGDVIFVTGTLGDSRAGLFLLQHDQENSAKEYFIKRHQMPTPRIEFAGGLKELSRVALNDISDGLASEAHEIAMASDVSLVLYDERIPVHASFNEFSYEDQMKWKYFGGEDFELLGTVPRKDWPFIEKLAGELNVQITEIGYVIDREEQPVYMKKDDVLKPLEKAGYTHLK